MAWRRSWSPPDNRPVKATYIPRVDAYKLSFPYIDGITPNFIESLKKLVPSASREYDHEFKEWTIEAKYWDTIILPLIKIIFADKQLIIADKEKVEEFNQGSTLTTEVVSTDVLAEKFFTLLEKAGLSPNRETQLLVDVKKLYYKATRFYHPDLNKDGAQDMSELTYLWSNLKGVYFKEQSNGK